MRWRSGAIKMRKKKTHTNTHTHPTINVEMAVNTTYNFVSKHLHTCVSLTTPILSPPSLSLCLSLAISLCLPILSLIIRITYFIQVVFSALFIAHHICRVYVYIYACAMFVRLHTHTHTHTMYMHIVYIQYIFYRIHVPYTHILQLYVVFWFEDSSIFPCENPWKFCCIDYTNYMCSVCTLYCMAYMDVVIVIVIIVAVDTLYENLWK